MHAGTASASHKTAIAPNMNFATKCAKCKRGNKQKKIMSILDFLWKNPGINVNPWIPPNINKRPCFWVQTSLWHPSPPWTAAGRCWFLLHGLWANSGTKPNMDQEKKEVHTKNIKTCGASCNLLYRWIRSETKKHRDLNPQQEGRKRTLDRRYHRNH